MEEGPTATGSGSGDRATENYPLHSVAGPVSMGSFSAVGLLLFGGLCLQRGLKICPRRRVIFNCLGTASRQKGRRRAPKISDVLAPSSRHGTTAAAAAKESHGDAGWSCCHSAFPKNTAYSYNGDVQGAKNGLPASWPHLRQVGPRGAVKPS